MCSSRLRTCTPFFASGCMPWALFCSFFWHLTAYRAFTWSLIGTDFQARLDYVAFLRDFVSLRMTALNVRSTLICAGAHAFSFHSLLSVSFGGVRCYSRRSSLWVLGYFDHWLARSACRQRVSLLILLALLSPCNVINGYVSWNYCTSKLMPSLHFPLAVEVHAMD